MDIGYGEKRKGFDVTVNIKNGNGPNASTPIIAVTAHEDPKYKVRATEVGMIAFMNKPLDWPELERIFGNLLN